VEVWKTEMEAAYRREFERSAGDLLAELGYETETPVVAGAADRRLPS
jgi:hypothetical protein